MMQIADKIALFFGNSPKRQPSLETWINNVFDGEKCEKLKVMCKNRCVEHHEAFAVFSGFLLPTVSSLDATLTVQLQSGIGKYYELMLCFFF